MQLFLIAKLIKKSIFNDKKKLLIKLMPRIRRVGYVPMFEESVIFGLALKHKLGIKNDKKLIECLWYVSFFPKPNFNSMQTTFIHFHIFKR